MKVVLRENIDNLGKRGDIVEVAAGFGRNYLVPRKLAHEVTSSNMKMIEMEQKALKKRLEKEVQSYQQIIEKLNQASLTFERKAGDKDVIFGSVSVTDIKEALDKLGFDIEKKKIVLEEPIKRLGHYTVPVKIFHEEKAEVKVEVRKEGEKEKREKEQLSEEELSGDDKSETAKKEEQPSAENTPQEFMSEEETKGKQKEKNEGKEEKSQRGADNGENTMGEKD